MKEIKTISIEIPATMFEMLKEIGEMYNMSPGKMANFLLIEGVKKDWENVQTLKRIREECKAKQMKDK